MGARIAPLTDQEAEELGAILGTRPETLIQGVTFRWLVDTGIEDFIQHAIDYILVPPADQRLILRQLAAGLDPADELLRALATRSHRTAVHAFLRQINLGHLPSSSDDLTVPQVRAIVDGARKLQQSFDRERALFKKTGGKRAGSSNYPDSLQFLARQVGLAKAAGAPDNLPGKGNRGDDYEQPALARFLSASVVLAAQKGCMALGPRSQLHSDHHLHLDTDPANKVWRRLKLFAGMSDEKLSRHVKFIRDWQRGQNF